VRVSRASRTRPIPTEPLYEQRRAAPGADATLARARPTRTGSRARPT
jgi:hypothetical protein